MIAKNQLVKNWQKYIKLAAIQKKLNYTLAEMLKIVQNYFHDDYYTKEEARCRTYEGINFEFGILLKIIFARIFFRYVRFWNCPKVY